MRKKLTKLTKKINLKKILLAALILVLVIIIISIAVGFILLKPLRREVTQTPAADLNYDNIEFTARDDELLLKGWYFPGGDNCRETTIIMAHGYGNNRLQDGIALDLTEVYLEEGYTVLLFDFRASGESEGDLCTIGRLETKDLLGAVDFAAERGDNHSIVLHGFSMGAATAIVAGAKDSRIQAVIADSPFADLKDYLQENLPYWTKLPAVPFNWTTLNLMSGLTEFDPEAVKPREAVREYDIPLLLIHGDMDRAVPVAESRKILAETPGDLAELKVFPGVDHVESFPVGEKYYISFIMDFLQRSLE